MTVEATWLVGSTYVAETAITIDGNATTFPAGFYYLRHTTAALSLIDTLEALMTAEGVVGANVYLGQDRLCYVAADNPVEIDWPSPLRDLFGFDVDLSPAAEKHTPDEISPLLWSAGKNESPQEAPLGVLGRSVYDTRFGTAPDGTMVADGHHTQVVNTFSWAYVTTARFQTAAALGGEFTVFFDAVLRRAYKFFLYRRMAEGADTAAVTWTSDPLGPYGYRPTRGSITWDFQRSGGFQNVDRRNTVTLDVLVTPEYEA